MGFSGLSWFYSLFCGVRLFFLRMFLFFGFSLVFLFFMILWEYCHLYCPLLKVFFVVAYTVVLWSAVYFFGSGWLHCVVQAAFSRCFPVGVGTNAIWCLLQERPFH